MSNPPDWYNKCIRTPRMRFWRGVYNITGRLRNRLAYLSYNIGWTWIWWTTHGYTGRLLIWANNHTTKILNEAYRKEQSKNDEIF